jgi:hypothetical protein
MMHVAHRLQGEAACSHGLLSIVIINRKVAATKSALAGILM